MKRVRDMCLVELEQRLMDAIKAGKYRGIQRNIALGYATSKSPTKKQIDIARDYVRALLRPVTGMETEGYDFR